MNEGCLESRRWDTDGRSLWCAHAASALGAQAQTEPRRSAEPQVKRIVIEDDGARIDELRVRGRDQAHHGDTRRPADRSPTRSSLPTLRATSRSRERRTQRRVGSTACGTCSISDDVMAVFTEVSFDEAARSSARLSIGELIALQRHHRRHREHQLLRRHRHSGRYVLTLFERLTLRAAAVLSAPDAAPGRAAAFRCPARTAAADGRVAAHAARQAGRAGRRAARRPRARARPRAIARSVGAMLARMHLARRSTTRATSPTCAACRGGSRRRRRCCPFLDADAARVDRRASSRSSSRSPRRRHTPPAARRRSMPTCSATT